MAQVIEMPIKPDYTGKTVTLSPEAVANRFQCRGFVVFRNKPALVPIESALLSGKLLELAPGSVLKTKNAALNPAAELGDTDKRIFTLQTKEGLIVITPETAEQAAAIEKELQETGQLDLSHYPDLQKQKTAVPHLTGIVISDLEPEEPNVKPHDC